MSRRITQPFRCQPLAELTRQLLFAPPDKRIEQVRRAEKLHDQIDPTIAYPFEFVSYRLTGYRSESDEESLLVGEAILPDLRLLIDTLSRSVDMPPPEGDTIETPEELAARLHVSTKTVSRWRATGLRWRWTPGSDSGHRRLVLTRSAVECFLAQNRERVERAAKFSHIEPAIRARLIERAQRIAEARDVTLNQVATHLARRTGRAIETIRMILNHHEEAHADGKIFADRTGPLTPRQKRVIARAYRMGVAIAKIARHFKRTRTTIYRVIHERRAAALRRVEIRFVASPMFTREDADQVILRPVPADPSNATTVAGNGGDLASLTEDLPEPLLEVFAAPGLDAELERSLLVRLNYLKFKAHQLREGLERREPRAADMDAIENLLAQAAAIHQRIVSGSQRILLLQARRHLVGRHDPSQNHLLELLELSQDVLAEAIASYDVARGQAFEAYLAWMLMRRFASHQATRVKAQRRIDAQAVLRRIALNRMPAINPLAQAAEEEPELEQRN